MAQQSAPVPHTFQATTPQPAPVPCTLIRHDALCIRQEYIRDNANITLAAGQICLAPV
jgi:hypothetical protein